MKNVVIYCGGRGSAAIIQELLRHSDINLTLIVNAYDDGLSTGMLRNFVSQMLGPSDFRKNLSYLLDPYSEEQYALKSLFEYRLSTSISEKEVQDLIEFSQCEESSIPFEPLNGFFCSLSPRMSTRIKKLLFKFFNYAATCEKPFDYRDCSIGNLIFTGAYLELNNDFNATTKEISHLVSSRASLVNVSEDQNRILAGLKADGEILCDEAKIVGPQSSVPIQNIFFAERPLVAADWQHLSLAEKESLLKRQETLPDISHEAEKALDEADIIIYGPGTQHSSLFPSYRISHFNLKRSRASVKIFVMNLDVDHDIKSLSASDIIDQALFYMEDKNNSSHVITHVLLNQSSGCSLSGGELQDGSCYRNVRAIAGEFANSTKPNVHNGRAVVEKIFSIYEDATNHNINDSQQIDIFIDIHKRSLVVDSLLDEFCEIDWKKNFSKVKLEINNAVIKGITLPDEVYISNRVNDNDFPEIDYFENWLNHGTSEYLLLLTGDGEYRFRDLLLSIRLLEQSNFGAVFGSRNQSRMQFKYSLQAAYGDNKLLSMFSFLGAYLMSTIFAFRYGIILSDPLTGFNVYKRSRIVNNSRTKLAKKINAPIAITKYLIANKVEIAELPVYYRTFSGFSDPYWRFRRGLKNLFSVFLP